MKYLSDKYLIIIFLLLSFSFASVGCTSTNSLEQTNAKKDSANVVLSKQQNIAQAKREELNNNPEKAIFYYIQALELDKNDVDVFCQIGKIQNSLNSPELAIRAFKQALTLNPDHIPALAAVGIYYLEQRNINKARTLLERTVNLDQNRLQKGNIEKGLLELDQDSPLSAYNVYAVLNDLDSQHEYAREIFKLLLTISDDLSLIHTNLGYSYYLTHHYVLAEKHYKEALNANPAFERAKLNLGLIYVRTGQYNKSIQLFKQVMTTAEAYNDIGYFLLLDGRYQEAKYFLQHAIDLSLTYYKKSHINLENVQLYLHEIKI
ncbi:tetratricopeptide repeat protein [Colwellia sp. TT2012]|uniref:tetratricopeptide repeat protein n=1 Tax=Colwellia sp. TT2012 TaxID=1720342 RepID=UPI00070A22A3|nr:tetratricopeptide repeat protein [Colwellia sp. TT2012]